MTLTAEEDPVALHPRTDETSQLEHVKEDLLREFADLPSEVVDKAFEEVVNGFTQAPVRSFVPVLARRGVQERLRHYT